MKELLTIDLKPSLVSSVAEGLITMENGDEIRFEDHHSQDCCEQVYAAFDEAPFQNFVGKKADSLSIVGVPDTGFLVVLGKEKVLVNCYNEQNGYYSNQLSIIIQYGSVEHEVDLDGYKDDRID